MISTFSKISPKSRRANAPFLPPDAHACAQYIIYITIFIYIYMCIYIYIHYILILMRFVCMFIHVLHIIQFIKIPSTSSKWRSFVNSAYTRIIYNVGLAVWGYARLRTKTNILLSLMSDGWTDTLMCPRRSRWMDGDDLLDRHCAPRRNIKLTFIIARTKKRYIKFPGGQLINLCIHALTHVSFSVCLHVHMFVYLYMHYSLYVCICMHIM